MKPLSFKIKGLIIGFLIGLGAPLGSIVLRGLFFKQFNIQLLEEEFTNYPFFYSYMAIATPFVFSTIGFCFGIMVDKIIFQKQSLEQATQILEKKSRLDHTTGIYNHNHILFELKRELQRSLRYGHPLSALMIDVDDFKKVNDLYGHISGDIIIKQITSLFQKHIRTVDILGRFGGDEFIIILPETALDASRDFAERIVKTVRNSKFQLDTNCLKLTVSVGVATFDKEKNKDIDYFTKRIDQAMYHAKHFGKDGFFMFEENFD